TSSGHKEEVKQATGARRGVLTHPYPEWHEIDETPIPPQFKELVVDPFDDSQDPRVHLQAFQTQVYINDIDDLINLTTAFESQFATNRAKHLEVADLFDIKQTKTDALKQYLAWFNGTMVQVNDPD
ncbi:hypothetical protein CR513_26891, partial [Mucuna pruriens]